MTTIELTNIIYTLIKDELIAVYKKNKNKINIKCYDKKFTVIINQKN